MNQRAGKTYKASGMDNGFAMKQLQFFKACKQQLEAAGYEDAAFYFEQCEDWLREGKSLDAGKAASILGL
jgi:hypothetical protein